MHPLPDNPPHGGGPTGSTVLARVVLEDVENALTNSRARQNDVNQAIADLQQTARFLPEGLIGPFILHLSVQTNGLVFDVRDAHDRPLRIYRISLTPFRRLIKDYVLLVDSFDEAVREGNTMRIRAIDMGRRGLHNDGAALMVERLRDKIDMDNETARRLFTLASILQQRR
ncbi:UPF0262 family protein [Gluconacetobacter aggeris]|uniref:UPF0262 family protein n=1 Tax=Gluconacetobacter aggeris TaxID=1286186 RepID=A0A7W4IVT3_9PROT|nr:UPF0262 family protein [Gluconacetobacter aggeris]